MLTPGDLRSGHQVRSTQPPKKTLQSCPSQSGREEDLKIAGFDIPTRRYRGGWGKLDGGVKWPPPPVRCLTKEDGKAQVSSHFSLLELSRTRGKL